MKQLVSVILFLLVACTATAQETHYHKGLRSQEENDKYGQAAAEVNTGGGVFWSRVRNVDDSAITHETPEDSLARVKDFMRLCRKAYDAYDEQDAYHTILYGDSALHKRFHTPDLYFFMAVSYEKLGDYKGAEWSYKKALASGYHAAPQGYADFKQRQKERKAEEKQKRKAKQ